MDDGRASIENCGDTPGVSTCSPLVVEQEEENLGRRAGKGE